MNPILQKLDEPKTIIDTIKKKLGDEFPHLTETQLNELANFIYDEGHPWYREMDYTYVIIKALNIALRKEN